MSLRQVRVARAFPPDFFEGLSVPPMTMQPGDALTIEDVTSSEWPAFVLVVDGKGERGWVPRRYLNINGDRAVAVGPYDTATLNPSVGDGLAVIEEDIESGWLWCRDEKGRTGWFAIDHLAIQKS